MQKKGEKMEEKKIDEQVSGAPRSEPSLISPKLLSKAYKIGINTVYRLTKIEKFPVITIGRKKLIHQSSFEDWLKSNLGKCI